MSVGDEKGYILKYLQTRPNYRPWAAEIPPLLTIEGDWVSGRNQAVAGGTDYQLTRLQILLRKRFDMVLDRPSIPDALT